MSLLGILALGFYAVGFLVCWRKLAYTVSASAITSYHRDMDWGDVGFGIFFGLFGAFVWPLVLVGWCIRHQSGSAGGFMAAVGSEPREARIERLQREAKARDQQIAELERELGIK